jgi:threonine dehydrogenase-like Zn-dependent dehydrogenase
MLSARLLGASKVIAIDQLPYRLAQARKNTDAITINFREVSVLDALLELTGGRGPDHCIDAVGMESRNDNAVIDAYDRIKHAARMETERPHALREAVMSCRNGGTVSIIGVYGGLMDKFPIGAVMNRSLTIKAGQCHVQHYMGPLLDRIRQDEIDPTFVITHHLPLSDAPRAYDMFKHKKDDCTKVILHP